MPEAHYSLLVDALNAQIKQKDDELEELKRRVNELSAEVIRLTHANETLEVQVSRLGGPSTVFIASQSSEEDDGNNTDIFTL
jgi:prefoldin subunit 5